MPFFEVNRDWTDLSYLLAGSQVQSEAYALLAKHRLLEKLQGFDPVLVGTYPIGIQTAGSDLDIICRVADFDRFQGTAHAAFHRESGYACKRSSSGKADHATVNFVLEGWPVEVYGQNLPVHRQNGYRHMVIEARLLALFGEAFRERVMRLRNEGLKTEPAFARVLQLQGDPYDALLEIESWCDGDLQALQSKES